MQNNVLATNLLGVQLKNPVIAASGTFGFGTEYQHAFDVSRLGGISGKGLTLNGSRGNGGRRIHETPSGMLNSIGLENPGVAHFVAEECHVMRATGCAVICNMGGHSESDYVEGARLLNQADMDILELNISCPNVKEGGMAFGMQPETAAHITRLVKQETKWPLLVKLSPNAPDLVGVAKACEEAGADGISLTNTFLGMAIDIKNKKPVFDNVYAGLSGPAVFPIALRMVHQVAHGVNIPVVGLGGVYDTESALAMIMAGAAAIQVGAMTFARPTAMVEIIEGLEAYCIREGLSNIHEICGCV